MGMSRDVAANAGALVAAILFGASVVAVRVAVREVPPLTLAILRFGQGGFLLLLLLLFRTPDLLPIIAMRLFILLTSLLKETQRVSSRNRPAGPRLYICSHFTGPICSRFLHNRGRGSVKSGERRCKPGRGSLRAGEL